MVKINMDIEGSYSQIDENITDINKKLSLLENEALSDLDRLELQEECLNLLTGNKKIFDFLVYLTQAKEVLKEQSIKSALWLLKSLSRLNSCIM